MAELRVCDVCRILDKDIRLKFCSYCKVCKVWICKPDLTRYDRRARAGLKRKLNQ